MEALDLQIYLRRCGVVVHHAAQMPPAADGRQAVVVFLEANLGQFELARYCALRLPGVLEVSFSGYSRAIMYVIVAEPGGRSARTRRPGAPGPNPQRLRTARRAGRTKGTAPDPRAEAVRA